MSEKTDNKTLPRWGSLRIGGTSPLHPLWPDQRQNHQKLSAGPVPQPKQKGK